MSETKEVPINFIGENITSRLLISTIKLFNGVPTSTKKKSKLTPAITSLSINHGFVFSPQVIANYEDEEMESLVGIISDHIGLTPDQMNSSFHKSWGKVRDAPMEQLVFEQLTHYMTTYGYQRLGVYDQNTVFIPAEKLDVPSLNDGVRLTVIHGFTKAQLKEKLLNLVNSGIALDDMEEIAVIAKHCELNDEEVLSLRNKELRVRLYKQLNLIPEEPLEFLRMAIFETTGQTLLITNNKMIKAIKESNNDYMRDLFDQYDDNFGYSRLAEIFLRFKRIFLAFKSFEDMPQIINRISSLSPKNHKRMKYSMLNNITAMISREDPIYKSKLDEELKNVNIFRKIRLAQSLKYRVTGNQNIMYKVRNGKSFATTMNFKHPKTAKKVYDMILDSIARDMNHLKGKKVYIPSNLIYALPATAKQFVGNIPSGSFVKCGSDMIFGIYWENVESPAVHGSYTDNNGKRVIDLDLHVSAQNAGNIGWDSQYRSANDSILFTGDITDAPFGATELYYVDKKYEDIALITLNYYNYDENVTVPFKIMIADEHPNAFGKNYTIDPNNMKCIIPTEISEKQKVLGLGMVKDGECRFYFNESGIGNTITTRGEQYMRIARNYLASFSTNQIEFNEILERVGAKIVDSPQGKGVIDLSPENLQKDTFINLLVKQ